MRPSPLAALAVFLLAFLPAHAGASDDAMTAGRSTTVEVAPQAQPQTTPPAQTAAAVQPPLKEEEESWFGIADWFGSDKASPALQATPQQFGSESLPPPPAAPGAPPPFEPLDHIGDRHLVVEIEHRHGLA